MTWAADRVCAMVLVSTRLVDVFVIPPVNLSLAHGSPISVFWPRPVSAVVSPVLGIKSIVESFLVVEQTVAIGGHDDLSLRRKKRFAQLCGNESVVCERLSR